jgi:hypothetical protein
MAERKVKRCRKCELVNPHVCLTQAARHQPVFIMFDELEPSIATYASSVADRIVTENFNNYADRIWDEYQHALVVAKRCKSCGAAVRTSTWDHLPDCDLDRSLTAQERYQLRHPEWRKRNERKWRIKRRWAVLIGNCGMCIRRPATPGYTSCQRCRTRHIDIEAGRKEAALSAAERQAA